jgi:hypothetical protein
LRRQGNVAETGAGNGSLARLAPDLGVIDEPHGRRLRPKVDRRALASEAESAGLADDADASAVFVVEIDDDDGACSAGKALGAEGAVGRSLAGPGAGANAQGQTGAAEAVGADAADVSKGAAVIGILAHIDGNTAVVDAELAAATGLGATGGEDGAELDHLAGAGIAPLAGEAVVATCLGGRGEFEGCAFADEADLVGGADGVGGAAAGDVDVDDVGVTGPGDTGVGRRAVGGDIDLAACQCSWL